VSDETPDTDEVRSTREEVEFLRSTPIETILGNHIFHLIQLAAVHLTAVPPNRDEARLAIDVAGAMIETGADRLGEHVGLYRTALAEVQQLFVRVSSLDAASESD
jgi:hypothetical protein